MLRSVNGDDINLPRITSTQTKRDNVSAKNPEEYYKRVMFLPFFDHLSTQLEERFTNHADLIFFLKVVLPNKCQSDEQNPGKK